MFTSVTTRELPSVNVSGNLYDDAMGLAEVLQHTLSDEIPGVGINHTAPLGTSTTPEENHRWDKVVLITALQQLSPANSLFLPVRPSVPGMYIGSTHATFTEGTLGHYDAEERAVALDGLVMVFRLHTADNVNGASVKLVNAYPGRSGSATGDTNIFTPGQNSPEAIMRGYETLRRVRSDELMESAMLGIHDPLLTDSTIYTFEQTPGSSVIFKTNSSLGPVAGHEFMTVDPMQRRDVVVSDIQLYSNPPETTDEFGEPSPEHLFKYWQDAANAFSAFH